MKFGNGWWSLGSFLLNAALNLSILKCFQHQLLTDILSCYVLVLVRVGNRGRTPRSKFECDLCHKVYKNKCTLNTHLKYECKYVLDKPSFPCPFCPHKSSRRRDLVLHVKVKHDDALRQQEAHGDFSMANFQTDDQDLFDSENWQ